METNKIAVDIVLIPPNDIIQLAIKLNKNFPNTAQEDYILDATTCIPHITLLMGLISRDRLTEAHDKLNNIVMNFSPLKLRATKITTSPIPDGKMFSSLAIEKSSDLQRLHETILDEMKPFFSWDDVTSDMFFSPPLVRELSTFWVKTFYQTMTRDNYSPHISLGFSELEQEFEPIEFTASKLALYHLGNYCTCRNEINSFPLNVRGIRGGSET